MQDLTGNPESPNPVRCDRTTRTREPDKCQEPLHRLQHAQCGFVTLRHESEEDITVGDANRWPMDITVGFVNDLRKTINIEHASRWPC